MAKVRVRFRRSLLVLLALCIVALLLELNRFLPGSWPGGGSGGFQAASVAGGEANQPDRPPQPLMPDAGTLAPPETTPETWPPRDGLRIELRGPDGDVETRWRLGRGRGGKEDVEPDSKGTLVDRTSTVVTEGFRVRTSKGLLRHGHGPAEPAARWVVHSPKAKLPRQRDAGSAGVRVVDAVTGKPIAGAVVRWSDGKQNGAARSDATGEAVVRTAGDGRLIRVAVETENRGRAQAWVSPHNPEPTVLELEEFVDVRVDMRFPPAGQPDHVDAFVLVAKDDSRLVEYPFEPPKLPGGPQVARIPRRALDGAWLWAIAATQLGEYVVRHRIRERAAEYSMPTARMLSVRVRDKSGRILPNVTLESRYPALEPGEGDGLPSLRQAIPPGGGRTGPTGTVTVPVPTGEPVRLLVQAPRSRPIVRSVAAVDGNTVLDVVAEPGIQIPVRVTTADGKPARHAQVLARASFEGFRIQRNLTTNEEGRVSAGPFGEGPVEIFALADGHAWSAVLVDAAPAMGTVNVRLQRGYPLTIVVEDPFGVPLHDVDVSITPSDGGPPLVAPPEFTNWRTDFSGRFTVGNLPNRLYDVGLTKKGYASETLRRLQPGAVTHFATLVRKP